MILNYLHEIPYTFGEIIKIKVEDTKEQYVSIRNEFSSVEALAFVKGDDVFFIPTSELKGKQISKCFGEDEIPCIHLAEEEILKLNVDLGQDFKDRILQIIREWPNHSFYIA